MRANLLPPNLRSLAECMESMIFLARQCELHTVDHSAEEVSTTVEPYSCRGLQVPNDQHQHHGEPAAAVEDSFPFEKLEASVCSLHTQSAWHARARRSAPTARRPRPQQAARHRLLPNSTAPLCCALARRSRLSLKSPLEHMRTRRPPFSRASATAQVALLVLRLCATVDAGYTVRHGPPKGFAARCMCTGRGAHASAPASCSGRQGGRWHRGAVSWDGAAPCCHDCR